MSDNKKIVGEELYRMNYYDLLDNDCYYNVKEHVVIKGIEDSPYSAPLRDVMTNIVDGKILDYKVNERYNERGNWCAIGEYEDMPGQEEYSLIFDSLPEHVWNEFSRAERKPLSAEFWNKVRQARPFAEAKLRKMKEEKSAVAPNEDLSQKQTDALKKLGVLGGFSNKQRSNFCA